MKNSVYNNRLNIFSDLNPGLRINIDNSNIITMGSRLDEVQSFGNFIFDMMDQQGAQSPC